MSYKRDLVNVFLKFDPLECELKDAFSEPISMALFMAYKINNPCNAEALICLTAGVVRISEVLQNNPDLLEPNNKETLKIFIKMNLLRGSNFNKSFGKDELNTYFDYVYPYLTGEKIASYTVQGSKNDNEN